MGTYSRRPPEQEISKIPQLIKRIEGDIAGLPRHERARVDGGVTVAPQPRRQPRHACPASASRPDDTKGTGMNGSTSPRPPEPRRCEPTARPTPWRRTTTLADISKRLTAESRLEGVSAAGRDPSAWYPVLYSAALVQKGRQDEPACHQALRRPGRIMGTALLLRQPGSVEPSLMSGTVNQAQDWSAGLPRCISPAWSFALPAAFFRLYDQGAWLTGGAARIAWCGHG